MKQFQHLWRINSFVAVLLLWSTAAFAADLEWAGDAKNTADNGFLAQCKT